MTPELEAQLLSCKSLPTPPGVATRIIALANDPDADMGKIAKVLAMDPAITIKILRIANSPMYAQQRKTENLRQAIVVLGLNATISLALSFSLVQSLEGEDEAGGLDYPLYWRRALLAATISRALAEAVRIRDAEELFLAALIQDIGMLALDRAAPELYQSIGHDQVHQASLIELEREQVDSDHASIGGWLLERWHFPERIQKAVSASHDPDSIPSDHEYGLFARCVAMSSIVAEVFLAQEGERPFQELAAAAERLVHMDKERLGELLRDIGSMIPDAEGVFETQFLVRTSTDNILDDAREALMLRNLRALQEVDYLQDHAESLASRTKELEETNRRDALTGLFNRGYLDRFLEFAFKEASEREEPLSIAFADLDKFKSINDTYGHQIGDQILVTTAEILNSSVRGSDVVARYGGEEFILVLPNTPADMLQTVCDRIVGTFRSKTHDVGTEEPLAVTISMGLATHGDKATFNSADEFVRSADKALYTAKLDGRDRAVPFHQVAGRKIKKMA